MIHNLRSDLAKKLERPDRYGRENIGALLLKGIYWDWGLGALTFF